MIIFNRRYIVEFQVKNPNAREPLAKWISDTITAQWENLIDLKEAVSLTDYLAPYCIFNVSGNRIISTIIFAERSVVVYKVLTDSEYKKWSPE